MLYVCFDVPSADATTVLLGECTHGTEEFYRMRSDITKYLIEARGFRVVLCEGDWPDLWHVNQYIHRKRNTMFPAGGRFPQWMWRNRAFVELVEWMRQAQSHSVQCYLFGMDCYCKEESKQVLRPHRRRRGVTTRAPSPLILYRSNHLLHCPGRVPALRVEVGHGQADLLVDLANRGCAAKGMRNEPGKRAHKKRPDGSNRSRALTSKRPDGVSILILGGLMGKSCGNWSRPW